MPAQTSTAYSPVQIALHWLIAALVIFQLIFGEFIKDLGRALRRGLEADPLAAFFGNAHIWVGLAIFALVALRIVLRLKLGVPPARSDLPAFAALAMRVTHFLFYALLVATPISGAIAWYLYPPIGEVHEAAKPLFIILIGLHVAATVWHHFVVKDDVLRRMTRSR